MNIIDCRNADTLLRLQISGLVIVLKLLYKTDPILLFYQRQGGYLLMEHSKFQCFHYMSIKICEMFSAQSMHWVQRKVHSYRNFGFIMFLWSMKKQLICTFPLIIRGCWLLWRDFLYYTEIKMLRLLTYILCWGPNFPIIKPFQYFLHFRCLCTIRITFLICLHWGLMFDLDVLRISYFCLLLYPPSIVPFNV